MSTCDYCEFAVWDTTKTGALHPQKRGLCSRLKRHPTDLRLPYAFCWVGPTPTPSGGMIQRGKEHVTPCVFKHRRDTI